MEAAIGLVAFVGGLAAINWVIHAFMGWFAELSRRDRRRGHGGGTRRLPPHPAPDGHPTSDVGPRRMRGDDRRPVGVE